MKFARISSVAVVGLTPDLVDVEVNVEAKALPRFEIVGLPGKAVEEAVERVRSAIKASGFAYPNHKIVVNLAPADIKKEGPLYDLPIALGILAASDQLPQEKLNNHVVLGELSLNGKIRGVQGVLPAAILCHQKELTVVAPNDNISELEIVQGLTYVAADSLGELVNFFKRETQEYTKATAKRSHSGGVSKDEIDFKHIHGQEIDRKSTRLNSSHIPLSRMPSSA